MAVCFASFVGAGRFVPEWGQCLALMDEKNVRSGRHDTDRTVISNCKVREESETGSFVFSKCRTWQ